jgi:hypothetical protein
MIYRRGFIGTLASATFARLPPTGWGSAASGIFNVRDFGAIADGRDDGPAIQRALDATVAAHGRLLFPPGTYSYSVSPNFAADDLDIVGIGRVVLRHTGTGPGFLVDGTGGEAPHVFNMSIENLILDAGAGSSAGFLFRDTHHGRFSRLRVIGGAPGTAGFRTEFFVANICEMWCVSANDHLAGPLPDTGILLTSVAPPRVDLATVDSTFLNCICEGCGKAGMVLEWARNNLVRGGTLENNRSGTGLLISPSATGNTFDGVYLEDNKLNVECRGAYTQLSGLYATGSPCRLSGDAHSCRVHGGYFTTFAVGAGVRDTKLLGVAATWLRDRGVRTQRWGCHDLLNGAPLPNAAPESQVAPTWTAVEVLLPWTSADGEDSPAGYRHTADGYLRLRGAVRGKPRRLPSTLFVLPEACRPTFRQRLPVLTREAHGVLEVRATGEVVLLAGKVGEVRLDGVSFEMGERA